MYVGSISDLQLTLYLEAQYPMITVPAGYRTNGMPFGLALMQTMFGEEQLVRYGSAIEDALRGTEFGRRRPQWWDYQSKNLILFNTVEY